MIPILILAAGASSRMRGLDKCAQLVDGQPLLRRLATEAASVAPTYVALHHHAEARAALIDCLSVTPLVIPEAAEGLSGTLRGAVASLPEVDALLIVLADLPRIGAPEFHAILAARDAHPAARIWRGATADGKPGHPILFDGTLLPDFAHLTGDGGGEPIVRANRGRTVLVPFADDRARLDLDTPEDWAAFRAR